MILTADQRVVRLAIGRAFDGLTEIIDVDDREKAKLMLRRVEDMATSMGQDYSVATFAERFDVVFFDHNDVIGTVRIIPVLKEQA